MIVNQWHIAMSGVLYQSMNFAVSLLNGLNVRVFGGCRYIFYQWEYKPTYSLEGATLYGSPGMEPVGWYTYSEWCFSSSQTVKSLWKVYGFDHIDVTVGWHRMSDYVLLIKDSWLIQRITQFWMSLSHGIRHQTLCVLYGFCLMGDWLLHNYTPITILWLSVNKQIDHYI